MLSLCPTDPPTQPWTPGLTLQDDYQQGALLSPFPVCASHRSDCCTAQKTRTSWECSPGLCGTMTTSSPAITPNNSHTHGLLHLGRLPGEVSLSWHSCRASCWEQTEREGRGERGERKGDKKSLTCDVQRGPGDTAPKPPEPAGCRKVSFHPRSRTPHAFATRPPHREPDIME